MPATPTASTTSTGVLESLSELSSPLRPGGREDRRERAAGKLSRTMVESPLNREHFAERIQISAVKGFLLAADIVRDLDIAKSCERREQVESLEDKADPLFSQASAVTIGERAEVHAIDYHSALGGAGQTTEQVKERGFSRTGGTDNGYKLAALDGERDAANGWDFNAP
jgi:hypothetical protein